MINELITVALRTLISYFVLLILLRIMGKREIGQLSVFDLLILLTLADVMVIGIEKFDESFWYSLIPVFLLTILQKVIAFIILKVKPIRTIIEGENTVVIKAGKLQVKTMRKMAYNIDDLLTQLRQLNIRSINEVDYAILESNGRLSAFLKTDSHKEEVFPLPLVVSGKLNQENLQLLNKGEEWFRKRCLDAGIKDLTEVYCLMYEQGKLVNIPFEES